MHTEEPKTLHMQRLLYTNPQCIWPRHTTSCTWTLLKATSAHSLPIKLSYSSFAHKLKLSNHAHKSSTKQANTILCICLHNSLKHSSMHNFKSYQSHSQVCVRRHINSFVINTLPRHWDLSSHVARDTFSALQDSISMWHLDSKNSYTGINDRQLVIYSGHWGESRSNMERIHSSLRMKHLLDHLLSSIVQHCHYFYLQRWGLSVLFCFFILFWIWDLGCKKQFQFLVLFCIWKAILIFCF